MLLGKEYRLLFTQSGYEVDGYNCTPDTKYVVRQTPTADSKAIDVVITLNYINEKLFTCPSVTVRTYLTAGVIMYVRGNNVKKRL